VRITRILICLAVLMVPPTVFSVQAPIPNPVLVFVGAEVYQANGKSWTRYHFNVDNQSVYPNDLFAASPDLPPCGKNAKASRTWVDLYTQGGKRLDGFCAFSNHKDLNSIVFALESSEVPPSWIYIEMVDRKTNTRYKSNLADTTP
jgi:hypothetical protein